MLRNALIISLGAPYPWGAVNLFRSFLCSDQLHIAVGEPVTQLPPLRSWQGHSPCKKRQASLAYNGCELIVLTGQHANSRRNKSGSAPTVVSPLLGKSGPFICEVQHVPNASCHEDCAIR